jgi:hypothetical protein
MWLLSLADSHEEQGTSEGSESNLNDSKLIPNESDPFFIQNLQRSHIP